MSTSTPNLQIPYIQAAQAQKHVTHNDAIRALDAIVQLAVKQRDLAAPPGSPANGDRFLVAASPSGAWAGKAGLIAAFQDGAWAFLAPQPGWLVWVQAESLLIVWNGTAWAAAFSQPTLNPTPLVGINATADTTNRLAVKSPAVLFDNAGNGHQLKVNKASAADTASVLFQDGYAGHAEMGLAGDDNFHIKVSADGAAWTEAVVIDKATGQVSFPHTSIGSGQVNPDWAATSGVAQILNKPVLGSAAALTAGTAAGNAVVLDSSAKLPAVDGSALVNLPAGSTGPQGPAGPTGPAGPQGPAGLAGGVYTVAPAYTNTGGQGARSSLITVTALSGMLSATGTGAPALVDGTTGSYNYTNSCAFAASSVSVTTASFFLFDFGPLSSKVITEATWLQSGTQSHGVWQWYGSNDGAAFTAIGTTFTLGGATSQAQTTLSANTAGYRYYKLGGVSGSASGGPYLYEIQFKIAGTVLDGVQIVPAGGSNGQILTQNTSGYPSWQNNSAVPSGGNAGQVLTMQPSGSTAWSSAPSDPYAAVPLSGMLAQWRFTEFGGTTCADTLGAYPIDLTLPSSQSYSWNIRGVKTTGGLIQTPSIPSARMVAMLYRVKRDDAGFVLSGGVSSGNGMLINGPTTTYIYTIGSGFGTVHPLVLRSTGANTYEVNRGGWVLLITDFNAAYTTPLGFGGRYGTTTSRCSEFELAWAGVWNRALTSTEQAALFGAMCKAAMSKGFYLAHEDCTQKADGVIMFGESTMSGRAPLSGLSAADQALQFNDTFIQAGANSALNSSYVRSHKLELGLNQMIPDSGYNAAANFGPEFGFAYQHRLNQVTRKRPAYILKAGLGSTYLSSAWPTVSTSWSNADTTKASLYYLMLRMVYDFEQRARLDGIGISLTAIMMMLGLNDANATTYAPDSATYQGYIQSLFTQMQTDLGLPTMPKMAIWQAHTPCTGADATALANVRAGQSAFVSANSANAVLITTDAYTKLADGVHWDAAGCKQAGIDGYTAAGL